MPSTLTGGNFAKLFIKDSSWSPFESENLLEIALPFSIYVNIKKTNILQVWEPTTVNTFKLFDINNIISNVRKS